MRENIDVFDFELSDEEMQQVAELDTGSSLFFERARTPWLDPGHGRVRLGF
jgi:diketogulonate reductase-like aldo/keto reductase